MPVPAVLLLPSRYRAHPYTHTLLLILKQTYIWSSSWDARLMLNALLKRTISPASAEQIYRQRETI